MRFRKDLVFSLFQYVLFAVSGIGINIILSVYYGAEILGLFNTVYATYIVLSQLCTAGQNFTSLSCSAHATENEYAKILWHTLIISVIASFTITLLALILAAPISQLMGSENMLISFRLAVLALPAFAVNKVMLGFLNGSMRIKMFSFLRTLRMVVLMSIVLLLALIGIDGVYATIIFPLTEILLLMILLYVNKEYITVRTIEYKSIRDYFDFGMKSLPIALIAEVNTRVDVICLNLFMTDKDVGIYSFALMFAEGIYQIYIVIRQVVNPYIVKYKKEKGYKYLSFFSLKPLLANYSVGGIGILVGLFIYGVVLNYNVFIEYSSSYLVFLIFIIGIVINSYFVIFSNYFVINKMPVVESRISAIVVTVNIVFNISLIPSFGLAGAAIATVISYTVASILQIYYALKSGI